MSADYQPSLLSDRDQRASDLSWAYNHTAATAMAAAELQQWKQRLHRFQQTVASTPAACQGSLFATEIPLSESIDPFNLPQRNAEFWRGQFQDTGVPAL
ncbi:hypothetical protein C7271_15540, partial [filamentous cyanobacterium CCP5]